MCLHPEENKTEHVLNVLKSVETSVRSSMQNSTFMEFHIKADILCVIFLKIMKTPYENTLMNIVILQTWIHKFPCMKFMCAIKMKLCMQ